MTPAVVIYTTNYCGYCRSAKRLLESKGIAFREVDVTHDEAARQWLVQVTGRQTVPQIWIGDRGIGGFTDLAALDKAGELESLVLAAEKA